jgi:hypothetical protein
VQIRQAAVQQTFQDPEYAKALTKFTGEDSKPLMPESLAKLVREIPREAAIIDLVKKLSGADPLPAR